MKSFRFALLALASLLTIVSCKPKPEEPESKETKATLAVESCSIKEGAFVDIVRTNSVTITFGLGMVKLSETPITLNGAAVTPKMIPDWTGIEIALALEAEKDYELIIPQGAVQLYKDNSRVNPEFKLHFTTKESQRPVDPGITAHNLVEKMGFGWNLGNHFDSYNEQFEFNGSKGIEWGYWDGAKPTQALYTNLVAAGVKTLRMPITWGNWQVKEGYAIADNFMAEVKQNVDWATEAGLFVLVNTHHDEYWQDAVNALGNPTLRDSIEKRIKATWQQIAVAFKDYDNDKLMFETFNEIHDDKWGWGGLNYSGLCQLMESWNQIAVDVIRATGGNNADRWIGVPSFCASDIFTVGPKHVLTIPNDPANKIMVAVHTYAPHEFCTKGTVQQWGHTATESGAAKNGEADVRDFFDKLKKEFIDKDIPIYVGEFGCETRANAADEKYRTYFMEYLCRASYFAGVPVMLWDNNNNNQGTGGGGECFWYVNHTTGVINTPELLATMVKAATSDLKGYTLESIYNNAPK